MAFATISDALRELRRGAMIIVADDEDRENESDLTMAAEKVTPDESSMRSREHPIKLRILRSPGPLPQQK